MGGHVAPEWLVTMPESLGHVRPEYPLITTSTISIGNETGLGDELNKTMNQTLLPTPGQQEPLDRLSKLSRSLPSKEKRSKKFYIAP
jgi:hypothetical protein